MSLDLAYSETGQGSPVIIVHGLFGWKRNWATIAKHLAQNHRVFSIDLRNHGDSPHAPEMTYLLMAEDMAHFINSKGLGPCPVIGHSMGGKTAMQLALTHGQLVERLMVIDIAPVDYSHDYDGYVRTMRAIDLSGVKRRSDVQPAIARIAESPGVEAFLMQNLTTDDAGGYRWRVNLDAIDRHMADIMSFPEPEPGQAYAGTTLFLGGELSDRILPAHHALIRQLFPAADIDFIADAGHWVHADQPAAILERFNSFLI